MLLLDTDHVSVLQQADADARRRLMRRIDAVPDERIATTAVTYEEQTRGWFGYMARAKTVAAEVVAYARLLRHLDFYREMTVVAFDDAAAVEFQRLRQLHVRVGTMDLKIAAVAIARDELLLTRNRADFAKVPGLRFEDWTK